MLKDDFKKPNGRFLGITYEDARTYAFIPKFLPPKIKWDLELVNKLVDAQKALAELIKNYTLQSVYTAIKKLEVERIVISPVKSKRGQVYFAKEILNIIMGD